MLIGNENNSKKKYFGTLVLKVYTITIYILYNEIYSHFWDFFLLIADIVEYY